MRATQQVFEATLFAWNAPALDILHCAYQALHCGVCSAQNIPIVGRRVNEGRIPCGWRGVSELRFVLTYQLSETRRKICHILVNWIN